MSKACKCVCEPPRKRKRRAPVYTRPPAPQFFISGLPPAIPQPTLADTVRLAVKDEFQRYHLDTPKRQPFYVPLGDGTSPSGVPDTPEPITMTQDLKGLLDEASRDVPTAASTRGPFEPTPVPDVMETSPALPVNEPRGFEDTSLDFAPVTQPPTERGAALESVLQSLREDVSEFERARELLPFVPTPEIEKEKML